MSHESDHLSLLPSGPDEVHGFRCVGPDYQHHLHRADHTCYTLPRELNPAIADCRLQGTANSPSSTALAEKVGFEPTIEIPLYTRSRRAPSTTQTSLHTEIISSNNDIFHHF